MPFKLTSTIGARADNTFIAGNTLISISNPSFENSITIGKSTSIGETGPTGPQGLSITGANGPQGLSITGPTGYQGLSIIGPTGPQGLSIIGPTGSLGPTGPVSIGFTGSTGIRGPTGPAGPAGTSNSSIASFIAVRTVSTSTIPSGSLIPLNLLDVIDQSSNINFDTSSYQFTISQTGTYLFSFTICASSAFSGGSLFSFLVIDISRSVPIPQSFISIDTTIPSSTANLVYPCHHTFIYQIANPNTMIGLYNYGGGNKINLKNSNPSDIVNSSATMLIQKLA